MTLEIAQSLVDVIMEQEQDDQGALFGFALTRLGGVCSFGRAFVRRQSKPRNVDGARFYQPPKLAIVFAYRRSRGLIWPCPLAWL